MIKKPYRLTLSKKLLRYLFTMYDDLAIVHPDGDSSLQSGLLFTAIEILDQHNNVIDISNNEKEISKGTVRLYRYSDFYRAMIF